MSTSTVSLPPDAALRQPACAIGNDGRNGPITRARQRRTLFIYLALALLGLAPWLVEGASPALRAAGLGLLLPGGGFVAAGGCCWCRSRSCCSASRSSPGSAPAWSSRRSACGWVRRLRQRP